MIESLALFLNELPLDEPIALAVHVRPDGDALGSAFGFASALISRGHTVTIVLLHGRPEEYARILPDIPTCETLTDAMTQFHVQKLFALDTANFPRLELGESRDQETMPIPMYVIDHHVDNQRYGVKNFVVKAAAAAEIVADAVYHAGWTISSVTATAFLTGILRDTGVFRFGNTSPSALRMAAILLEYDADYQKIIEDLWFSRPLNQVHAETDILLNHTFFHVDGQIAVVCADEALLKNYNITLDSSDDLLDQARSIKGVNIVVFIMNIPKGTKVSMRSKHMDWPVGPTARRLGGGGHDMAASTVLPFGDFEAVAQRVVCELLKDKPKSN